MRLKFEKALVFHFCELVNAFKMADVINHKHLAFLLLHELGFRAVGINEMKLLTPQGEDATGVGRFIIPIA